MSTLNENAGASQPSGQGDLAAKKPSPVWESSLKELIPVGSMLIKVNGRTRPILANALAGLRKDKNWRGVLAYNEFKQTVKVLTTTPWGSQPEVWTDQDDRLTAEWLQRHDIFVSTEVAAQAIETVARERLIHPVRQYFEELEWDGTPRLDSWLIHYLGVRDSGYVRVVGPRWMISAVARIFRPGCKADACLILEGPQGSNKSTALRILAGEWFTDELAELGTKDSAMQLIGVLIVEMAELDVLTKTEVSRIKAFMSRSSDRFRPPYGRHVVEVQRQCVFAGTVNHTAYLRDETGARRFWPVKCGYIDIENLRSDRDQLWAEAVHRYRAGDSWWLDSEPLNEAAALEQADRYDDDPWTELIDQFVRDRDNVSVSEILRTCLDKPESQWGQVDKTRVARILQRIGWERFRSSEGQRQWRYRPKVSHS